MWADRVRPGDGQHQRRGLRSGDLRVSAPRLSFTTDLPPRPRGHSSLLPPPVAATGLPYRLPQQPLPLLRLPVQRACEASPLRPRVGRSSAKWVCAALALLPVVFSGASLSQTEDSIWRSVFTTGEGAQQWHCPWHCRCPSQSSSVLSPIPPFPCAPAWALCSPFLCSRASVCCASCPCAVLRPPQRAPQIGKQIRCPPSSCGTFVCLPGCGAGGGAASLQGGQDMGSGWVSARACLCSTRRAAAAPLVSSGAGGPVRTLRGTRVFSGAAAFAQR